MLALPNILNLQSQCSPADLGFLDTAAWQFTHQVYIAAPPQKVFDVVADPDSWASWFPGMNGARFLSTPGPGARREVDMGLLKVTEEFIAWEPGKQFSFYLLETSLPMTDRWVEDIRFTAEGSGTSVLYRVSLDPIPPLSLLEFIAKPVLNKMFGDSLIKLKEYIG